jgi:response regulator RpfG family c-di-GMP phosphodiesterase
MNLEDSMSHVLIVDDDPAVRRLLHRWIDAEGVRVVEAASAEQGLLLASQEPPAVALCDINMPQGKNGLWLVEQLRRLHPETAAVMTTGVHDFDAAVTSLRAGVTDYIVKPLSRDRVSHALARAVAEHESRRAAAAQPTEADEQAEAALLTVLHAQDQTMFYHAQRISTLAAAIGGALGVSETELTDIRLAALLRDVTRHDVHAIARMAPAFVAAYSIAMAAQERFDGTGFPLGLKGDAIPLGARIVGAAEAYDELVSGDTGATTTPASAVEMLQGERSHQFDPAVLQALSDIALEDAADK